jgi:hypothetical protein
MRIPLGACVKRGGGDWRAERESGGGWRGFDGSIKKEKKKKRKGKKKPSFPLLSILPFDADVERCDSNVGTSRWLSASRVGRIQLKLRVLYFCISSRHFYFLFLLSMFFFLHNNNDPSAYKAQEEEELPVENPKRRWFPGASPNKFRSSIFFFLFLHLVFNI